MSSDKNAAGCSSSSRAVISEPVDVKGISTINVFCYGNGTCSSSSSMIDVYTKLPLAGPPLADMTKTN